MEEGPPLPTAENLNNPFEEEDDELPKDGVGEPVRCKDRVLLDIVNNTADSYWNQD